MGGNMTESSPIIVILAGGAATRMGGADKALIEWQGERLIDRIYDRLKSQGDIVISGREDYGKGCPYIMDDPNGAVKGPAAGLEAVMAWMKAENLPQKGFFTVPVDGPNPPTNLVSRLGGDGSAVAVDTDGYVQPTFAYWTRDALGSVLASSDVGDAPSLKFLSRQCKARRVMWDDKDAFLNINSPNDI